MDMRGAEVGGVRCTGGVTVGGGRVGGLGVGSSESRVEPMQTRDRHGGHVRGSIPAPANGRPRRGRSDHPPGYGRSEGTKTRGAAESCPPVSAGGRGRALRGREGGVMGRRRWGRARGEGVPPGACGRGRGVRGTGWGWGWRRAGGRGSGRVPLAGAWEAKSDLADAAAWMGRGGR